jgi:uncharacterized phage protein gp47/JayE
MKLPTQSFEQMLENMSAVLQGSSQTLVDLSVGSVLRAILEANASVALWIQWLILRTLQITRAATSTGTDLDSWMADFAVVRLPASLATGNLAFSRFANSTVALVPAGSLVKTVDGAQTFIVTIDETNPAWSMALSGYVMAISVSSIMVPASAQIPGSQGNVLASTISMIASSIPGVDTVNNPAAFGGGYDQETDSALRTRFQDFLATRARGTLKAVGYAISSLQPGLHYVIHENLDASGNRRLGYFTIVVDDGSGTPPSSLLSSVATAVDAVRPVGSIFSVQPPSILTASVSLCLWIVSDNSASQATSAVQIALTRYVNNLLIGRSLSLTRIAEVAYRSSHGIVNITGVTINGNATDLVPSPTTVIKSNQISVSSNVA